MPKKPKQASLYELLRVERTATTSEIRKAFLILAKKVHPDKQRAEGKVDDAGEAFKALRKAHDILSDPKRRELYDRTGIADQDDPQSFQEAYERFRGVKITEADIEQFEAQYRASNEEEEDLCSFFLSKKGDVRGVLAYIIGSRDEDIPRFLAFWDNALNEGRLDAQLKVGYDLTKARIMTSAELNAGDDAEDSDEEDESEGEEDDEVSDEEEGTDDNFIASEDEDDQKDNSDDDEMEVEGDARLKFTPGDLVQGKWRSGKMWYDAFVMGVNRKDKTYDLEYVRDKVKEVGVPASLVREKMQEKESPMKKTKTDENDLAALIMARGQARQNQFLVQMEAKYTKKGKKM